MSTVCVKGDTGAARPAVWRQKTLNSTTTEGVCVTMATPEARACMGGVDVQYVGVYVPICVSGVL